MIDYFFRWADEAAAKADVISAAQKFGVFDKDMILHWARDHVLPNVRAWRPSQDTTQIIDGRSVVVHNYLTGWFAIVALQGQNQTLLNASALAFALNRNGPPYVIKNNIGGIINDVACEPIFAGSHYPLGGYS